VCGVGRRRRRRYRERKCADTTGTVLVPWTGHFQCEKCKYIFFSHIKHTEAISSNITCKLLWHEITKMLIAVQENNFI